MCRQAIRHRPYSPEQGDRAHIDCNGVIQAVYRGQLDDETTDRYVEADIEAVPGGKAPFRLRLVNRVPREHVLAVFPDEEDPGQVLLVSRRFRCDDAYCAAPAVDRLSGTAGVAGVDLRSAAESPALSVTFDLCVIELNEVVGALAEALRAHPDPLYTRQLELRFPDGER